MIERRWILLKILLLTLPVLLACSCAINLTYSPPERELVLPRIFESVAYRSTYHQKRIIGFEHVANLSINQEGVRLYDNDVDLMIPFSDITSIEYKKIYWTDPNNFIIVHYSVDGERRIALFTAFRYAGWVGGSSEIYEIITLAFNSFKS